MMSDSCMLNDLDIARVENKYLMGTSRFSISKIIGVGINYYLECFIMAGLGSPVVPEV